MLLTDLADAFENTLAAIETEKGPVELAAILQNKSIATQWDILISAPWAQHPRLADYEYLASKLRASLPNKCLSIVGQIAIMAKGERLVEGLMASGLKPGKQNAFYHLTVAGTHIDCGIIFRLKRIPSLKPRHSARKK